MVVFTLPLPLHLLESPHSSHFLLGASQSQKHSDKQASQLKIPFILHLQVDLQARAIGLVSLSVLARLLDQHAILLLQLCDLIFIPLSCHTIQLLAIGLQRLDFQFVAFDQRIYLRSIPNMLPQLQLLLNQLGATEYLLILDRFVVQCRVKLLILILQHSLVPFRTQHPLPQLLALLALNLQPL